MLPTPFKPSPSGLDLTTALCKITDMFIPTVLAEPFQCRIQLVEVVLVLSTGSSTPDDMLGQCLRILRTQELRIVGKTNVHQTLDLLGQVAFGIRCRVHGLVRGGHVLIERGVLDAVAVDLSNVEVLLNFGDVSRWNAVCGTPDSRGSGRMLLRFVSRAVPVDASRKEAVPDRSMSPIRLGRSASRPVLVPLACHDGLG